MDDAAADYHHGDQNISEQLASYRAFGGLTKWGSLIVATLVLMLTLWFCLGVDFLGGLIPGLILVALGVTFLRSKPAQDH
jgi:hypothetical protein